MGCAMRWLVGALALVAASSGCLPADDRPEPGSVLLNVERSAAAADGFQSDDGWSISFTRFITAIGNHGFEEQNCKDYSSSQYDRLHNFAVAGTAKQALHFGLGDCTLGFSVGSPSPIAILMDGVSEADLDVMAIDVKELIDPGYGYPPQQTVGMWVAGSATRAGTTKSFNWLLRWSTYSGSCYAAGQQDGDGARPVNRVLLEGGEEFLRSLRVRPQELFREMPDPSAPIAFTRFADADVNNNGVVSLEELQAVEVPPQAFESVFDFGDALDRFGGANLALLVEQVLTTRVVTYQGADSCEPYMAFDF